MMRSTLPLFPSDDGWPYPDTDAAVEANLLRNGFVVDDEVDLDALELSADRHAFDGLTLAERDVIERRFGHGDSMKTIACELGCTHAEAADLLGRAVDKMRDRVAPDR